MKVILLKAVPKVGKAEDIVEVNEGYARNALFPKKLAVPMTQASLAELHRKQSSRVAEQAIKQTLLEKAIADLSGKSIVYRVNANEQGNLFSKIDAHDIAQFLLTEHRINVDAACVIVPDDHIKKLGQYAIGLKERNFKKTFTLQIEKK